jgi:ribosome hibernation promoting factor
MEISIKGRHLELSDPLRAYTERRLRFSLDPFESRLKGVEVRIADVNGPRGGVDKTCGITLILDRVAVVFVQASAADAYAAIDRAVSRAHSALSRRLSRGDERRRCTLSSSDDSIGPDYRPDV